MCLRSGDNRYLRFKDPFCDVPFYKFSNMVTVTWQIVGGLALCMLFGSGAGYPITGYLESDIVGSLSN